MTNDQCQIAVFIRHLFIRILLPSFVIFNLTFVIQSPVFATITDLTINADRVTVEKDKKRIEAEGSVEVVYKDFSVTGGHLIYDTSKETLAVDKGFVLLYEGMTFEGQQLDYLIEGRTGTAVDFHFNYSGIMMNGQRLELARELYKLNGVAFTTCDLPAPHYRVSASEVLIYPEYQRLVAYWGLFWLGNLPVVPMPTYIYDFRADEKSRKNLPPFPEIGSNAEDGNYINERLAWNLNPNFSGNYTLSYFSNKGVGLGASGDYVVNEQNYGNIRLMENLKDGMTGGLTHNYNFGSVGEPTEAEKQSFFPVPRRRQFDLELTLSSRERINYQKVSFLPNLAFRSARLNLLRPDALLDLEIMAGSVAEEGNTRLLRGGGNATVYGDFKETEIGFITPSLNMDNSFYSNGTRWLKSTANIDLSKRISPSLGWSLGYSHYLLTRGQSPFNFEMYRFRAVDRLKGKLIFAFGETSAMIASSYFLDNYSPEDIDYTLFFRLHCYNLEVTYRSLRSEFALGFSLASGK
jgi:hypothetical protein